MQERFTYSGYPRTTCPVCFAPDQIFHVEGPDAIILAKSWRAKLPRDRCPGYAMSVHFDACKAVVRTPAVGIETAGWRTEDSGSWYRQIAQRHIPTSLAQALWPQIQPGWLAQRSRGHFGQACRMQVSDWPFLPAGDKGSTPRTQAQFPRVYPSSG
jgi:hypothetical protein